MKTAKHLLAMVAAALIVLPIFAAEQSAGEVRKTESEAAEKRRDGRCPHSPQCGDRLKAIEEKENRGLIPGCKFTPLQLWIGVETKLFDADADTVFSFGLLVLAQKSAVLSLAPLNFLTYNYGFQIAQLGSIASVNYGISFSPVNVSRKNYGLQIGAVNFAGDLHGVQIGMLNFNNTGLKCFPIVNAGF